MYIAGQLRSRMRRTDVLARWGGEEFVLLLPDTDVHAARRVADALRQAVAATADPTWGRITVRVGLAQNESSDASLDGLLARADRALYRAKDGGRNQVSAYNELG